MHISYFSNLVSENRAVYEIMWKNMVDLDYKIGASALHGG